MKQKALQIYLAGVNSVLPDMLVRTKLINEEDIINNAQNLYLLAIGKAAFLMAKETEELLGNRIKEGLVVTKYGHGGELKHLKVIEAGHPIPDKNGVSATKQIVEIAEKAKENDLVICLISGGASALLADYPEGATLNDLKAANQILIKSGITITEINCIRKHLSMVKGGQLAKLISPATTLSLILSDVVGDQLDVIASGITSADTTTYSNALEIIKEHGLEKQFPQTLIKHLHNGELGLISETPKPGDPIFNNVHNHIIGNNRLALEGAAKKAEELKLKPHIISNKLNGNYTQIAEFILNTIDIIIKSNHTAPVCLLFGGEPTVEVKGDGIGGRNQHIALHFATKINNKDNITILCAGTDGTDGPTDAAGAIVDGATVNEAMKNDINPDIYLSNFDSYHFFKQTGDLIITGSSGTNVMDIIVVLIE
mgnify:FL=1